MITDQSVCETVIGITIRERERESHRYRRRRRRCLYCDQCESSKVVYVHVQKMYVLFIGTF